MEKQSSLEQTPKISVVMSVKNGADTLHKSMESILNQTFTDFEFIICDDGSTDNTLELLNQYAQKDNRIKIIHNDASRGLAYSLNACIEKAKSNILARQDADDASDIRRFEIQYPFVLEHPEYTIVGTCWYNVNSNGEKNQCVIKSEPSAKDMIKGGLYLHPSWMMRKDELAKVGFYTVNKYTMRSQDYHLVMKVLANGMKLYNMSEFLYFYTADENTISRSRNWARVKGLMWIRWDSYRKNKLPLWAYLYVLKPFLANIIPKNIMNRHYKKIYGKQKDL